MGVAVPVFLLGAAIDELRRTGEAARELAARCCTPRTRNADALREICTSWIRLAQQPSVAAQKVMLSIEDFGKGIPNNIRVSNLSSTKTRNHVPEGLGLVSMRERLNQVGGCLEIDSVRGKTVIRAIVKLNSNS